jgi:hypothetical protein
VIQALEAGASQAKNPDNTLGYGIVNFAASYNLLHPGSPLGAKGAAPVGEGLAIFPNPSHLDELMLALPASLRGQVLRVRVRDVKGALIGEQLLPASPAATAAHRRSFALLPSRVLAPGTYVCTVQPVAGGAVQTVRFVRQ